MQFLEQLMTSMGQNVKFSVEQVCEGVNFTAGISWHLGKYHLTFPITFMCLSLQYCIIHEQCNKFKISMAEWKGRKVPFTRGCSFYECSLEGETLLIK